MGAIAGFVRTRGPFGLSQNANAANFYDDEIVALNSLSASPLVEHVLTVNKLRNHLYFAAPTDIFFVENWKNTTIVTKWRILEPKRTHVAMIDLIAVIRLDQ